MLDDPRVHWLAATIALELLIAVPLLGAGFRLRERVLAVLAVNLTSFPLALLAIGEGAPWLAVEGAVVALETVGLSLALGASARSAGLAALLANAVTASLAFALP